MGFTITKVTKRNYNITSIVIPFTTYVTTYLEIRERFKNKLNTCFNCNHKFTPDDKAICLATVENDGNKVLCLNCAENIAKECKDRTDIQIMRNVFKEESNI